MERQTAESLTPEFLHRHSTIMEVLLSPGYLLCSQPEPESIGPGDTIQEGNEGKDRKGKYGDKKSRHQSDRTAGRCKQGPDLSILLPSLSD